MQISRDTTQRPGVGTLMYMGEEPTSIPVDGKVLAAGGIALAALYVSLKVAKGVAKTALGLGAAYVAYEVYERVR